MHRPTNDTTQQQTTPRRRPQAGGLRVLDLARANLLRPGAFLPRALTLIADLSREADVRG